MDKSEQFVSELIDTRLDALVDDRESVEPILQAYPDQAEEIQDALLAARVLRSYREYFTPSAGFVDDSKRLLFFRLAKIRRGTPKKRTLAESFRFMMRFNWATAMVLVALLLVSLTGVTYAAGLSVPGDFVYPVKTLVENATIALQKDPMRKSELYMVLADRRLAEMEILAARGQFGLVDQTMQVYLMDVEMSIVDLGEPGDQSSQVRMAVAEKLGLKLAEHLQRLETLKGKLPEQAQVGIDQAIQVSGRGLSVAQQAVQGNPPGLSKTPVPANNSNNNPSSNKPVENPGANNSSNNSSNNPDRELPDQAGNKLTKTPRVDQAQNEEHPVVPTPKEQPTKKKTN